MKVFPLLTLSFLLEVDVVYAFSSLAIPVPTQAQPYIDDITSCPNTRIPAVVSPITWPVTSATTYEDALRIIDECALKEQPSAQLYDAVRLVERNPHKYYPESRDREELWGRAHGCWKLVLTTGNAKTRAFHPPKYLMPFSFAMINQERFGNGFGLNADTIWFSVLQKHHFNSKFRQMLVTVDDVYVGGHKATPWFPDFVKKAINLGKTPQDFRQDNKRVPAMVIVASSENALVARGNQSGSLVVWKKIPTNIQPVAFRDL